MGYCLVPLGLSGHERAKDAESADSQEEDPPKRKSKNGRVDLDGGHEILRLRDQRKDSSTRSIQLTTISLLILDTASPKLKHSN